MGRPRPAARPHGPGARRTSTGTSGSASRPSGRSSATATTTPATGASGSTSAPAPSATWAATSSTRSSARWPLTRRSPSASDGGAANADNWGLDSQVKYVFPGTKYTTEHADAAPGTTATRRPPAEVQALIGDRKLNDQGSIYIGTEGVLYSPYIDAPGPAAGREVHGLQAARSRAATTTTCSSWRPSAATARPRRRSPTPAR